MNITLILVIKEIKIINFIFFIYCYVDENNECLI